MPRLRRRDAGRHFRVRGTIAYAVIRKRLHRAPGYLLATGGEPVREPAVEEDIDQDRLERCPQLTGKVAGKVIERISEEG